MQRGAWLLAVLVVGCSGAGSSSSSSSSSSTGGGVSSSAGTSSGPHASGSSGDSGSFARSSSAATLSSSAAGSSASVGTSSSAAGNSSSDSATSSSGPRYCGGILGAICGANEYCDYLDLLCGAADGQGTCTPRPADCQGVTPVDTCGCDGTVHTSTCAANLAGQDRGGYCTAPVGTHPCGSIFCQDATEYCQEGVGGAVGNPPSYQCLPLPTACNGAASCACLASVPCGSLCADSNGIPVVTCQYP